MTSKPLISDNLWWAFAGGVVMALGMLSHLLTWWSVFTWPLLWMVYELIWRALHAEEN